MIAAVLVHPAVSIALGAAALVGLWWYWARLGSFSVPVSRRRLRRMTTMALLVSIPVMVVSMSFIDRVVRPREFVIAWSLVMLLMLLVILGAALDALNSVRLHVRDLDREVADAARELRKAARRRDREAGRRDHP